MHVGACGWAGGWVWGAGRGTGEARHRAATHALARSHARTPAVWQANSQCCSDNPDALTHHEVLLPGHLLLKFLREQLETALEAFKAQASAPRSLHMLCLRGGEAGGGGGGCASPLDAFRVGRQHTDQHA